MKKRLISMALAASMAISVVPAPVLAANIGGGGKNSADPDPITVQKLDSLDGLFQPPSTLPTLNQTISGTTEVSDEAELKEAVKTSGSVTLKNDIVLTGTLTIPANVTVNLNLGGYTLKASDTFDSDTNYWGLIEINGGTLTLTNGILDGNGKTMCVYVSSGRVGLWADATYYNGNFTLGAGATIQNGLSSNGAGVFINKGTFTMLSGSRITDCHAEETQSTTHPGGGAVCVANSSSIVNKFEMQGGIIENCAATEGGAVYNGSTFTMTGGTIKNCSSNTNKDYNRSSAVYNNGTFSADGGEVKGTVHNIGSRTIASSGASTTTFSDTVYNEGTIGSGKFDGTVNNSGTINGGTFKKIETAGNGSIANTVTGYELVQLISLSDLASKIPTTSGQSVSLKLNGIESDNKIHDPLTIPEGVTVNLDLGENNLEEQKGSDGRKILTVNGTLNLTNGVLNVPITNNGTLNADSSVTIAGKVTNAADATLKGSAAFTGDVDNYSTISEGAFTGDVCNYNTISDGAFEGPVLNVNSTSKITNGIFVGAVENHGSITGGTFKGRVDNYNTIEGANSKFTGDVYNCGTIKNGTFDGKVTNFGTIEDGNFTGTVENKSEGGKISGGTFTGSVTNSGTVNGGNFAGGKFTNDGGQVSPNAAITKYKLSFDPEKIKAEDVDGNEITPDTPLLAGTWIALNPKAGEGQFVSLFTVVAEDGSPVQVKNEDEKCFYVMPTQNAKVETTDTDVLVMVTAAPAKVACGYTETEAPVLAVVYQPEEQDVNYQWYAVTDAGRTAIKGATERTYTLETGKDAGTYTYLCGISNGKFRAESNPVTVTVRQCDELTVKNAEVTIENAGKTVEVAKAEDGTLTAKVPEGATVTVKYTAPTDAIVFDLWSITSDATLDVNVKENPLTFTMPDKAVTVEAMTRDATIESEGPGVLGTAAMIGVGVAGTAVLGYQGYMIGTELYLNSVLPEGVAIPQNYGELALLVWNNAGRPEPAAVMAADATDAQKALTWAVENQLISADKAADASVTRWEVIRAWNKVQEMKKV